MSRRQVAWFASGVGLAVLASAVAVAVARRMATVAELPEESESAGEPEYGTAPRDEVREPVAATGFGGIKVNAAAAVTP